MKRIWLGASLLFAIVAVGLALWATVAGAAGDAGGPTITTTLDASTKTAACLGPAAAPCSLVRYGILLANAGSSMPRVSVLDPLPPGTQYVLGSAQGGLQYDPSLDAMTWIGSLPAKSTLPLSFTVRSLVSTPITVTNVATICGELTAAACITRTADIRLGPAPAATPTVTPTPPAGIECGAALTMTLGNRYYAGATRLGASGILTYSCAAGWLESGPEAVYRLAVDRPLESFTVSLSRAQQDLDLFVLSDCDPLMCVAAGDRTVTIDKPAGVYYVVVDGQHDAMGEYLLDLTWVAGTPAPTATATSSPTGQPSVTRTVSPSVTATPGPPTITPTPTLPLPTATPTNRRRPVLPLILRGFPRPPAPTATPTPSYPVSLDHIWIEGPKGVVNASFRPCEVIYEYLQVVNYAETETAVRVDWIVRDMSLREVPALTYRDAGPFTIPGSHMADIALPSVLPPDAVLGSYELKIRLHGPKGLIAERVTYFSLSGEDPVSPPLAELVLCHGIVDGLPAQPAADAVFSTTDESTYAWVWLQRMSDAPHTVNWIWYRPDGQRYDAHQEQVTGSCTLFAWGWMKIAGSAAATMPGTWKLEVRLDGQLLTQRSFQIVAAGGGGSGAGQQLTGGGYLANPCQGSVCPPPAPR